MQYDNPPSKLKKINKCLANGMLQSSMKESTVFGIQFKLQYGMNGMCISALIQLVNLDSWIYFKQYQDNFAR